MDEVCSIEYVKQCYLPVISSLLLSKFKNVVVIMLGIDSACAMPECVELPIALDELSFSQL